MNVFRKQNKGTSNAEMPLFMRDFNGGDYRTRTYDPLLVRRLRTPKKCDK